MGEYNRLHEDVEAAKQNKGVAVSMAEEKVEMFVRAQVFTGDELMKMRDEIKERDGVSGKVALRYILKSILEKREE